MAKQKDNKYKEFKVRLWLTDLNSTEVGIYQHTRHQAKSRQFSKDMDIFGEVSESGERKNFLAFREKLWEKETNMERRLVIKLFSASMNWKGTMDLMMGRSMQLTHGANGFPVLAFNINLANQDYIINVERSAYQWIGMPEKFSFFVMRDGTPYFYRLHRKFIGIGIDYHIYDQNNNKVGKLDGRVLRLGATWNVRVLKDHSDAQLNSVLQMFCGMLKFNDECRDHIRNLVAGMQRGKFNPSIGANESELYMNPRRTR
ncbi:MAG: hypothetical protein AAF228_08315 [Pseudomonadota bacterium]